MSKSSKDNLKLNKSSSFIASQHFKKKISSQTAEGITSIKDYPLKLKKEEASKPIYLIRYE